MPAQNCLRTSGKVSDVEVGDFHNSEDVCLLTWFSIKGLRLIRLLSARREEDEKAITSDFWEKIGLVP